jgi:hypothetical protein
MSIQAFADATAACCGTGRRGRLRGPRNRYESWQALSAGPVLAGLARRVLGRIVLARVERIVQHGKRWQVLARTGRVGVRNRRVRSAPPAESGCGKSTSMAD